MKLENQVCSLELAKQLKKLGVKQESMFYWLELYDKTIVINHALMRDNSVEGQMYMSYKTFKDKHNSYSAFTVAELGEMLLIQFTILKGVQISDPRGRYSRLVKRLYIFEDEANARAKMLIYLLENDLIKNK